MRATLVSASMRPIAPAFACLFLAAVPALAQERPRVEPVRTTTPPAIDGRLDDAVWQGMPSVPETDWLTYNPLNGDHIPQRTEVRVAYDDRALYFAFRCDDPEPQRVRGTLSAATTSSRTTGWASRSTRSATGSRRTTCS